MKKSELIQIIREEISKILSEASTEFEFDPTIYASGDVKVKEGEDFLYGRVVGKNYTFTKAKLPNAGLKISRWKEGKEPNNYAAYLSVPDEFSSLFTTISTRLKRSGKIANSTGTSSTQYSRLDLTKNELVRILDLFKTIKAPLSN